MIGNILETVGNTPMILTSNINKLDNGQILLKYERNNPGGSIKDRPALYIIEQAEKNGWLKPDGIIIESSSGNFGISLAMIGASKGYRVIILVDPKTTSINLKLLKSFGAEVVVVHEQDDSGSYHKTRISLANKMASEIPNSFRPDQCFNLLNSEAHYKNTAKEILKDCDGDFDVLIAAVSTGGQLGGISKYLKTYKPNTRIIAVDAEGSTIFGGSAHSYKIPGIGLSWTPKNLSLQHIDCVYKISDEHAFVTARLVARKEGILMGPSSGACVFIALKIIQEANFNGRIVCMVADGGERYINTLFDDEWMIEQKFTDRVDLDELYTEAKRQNIWSDAPTNCINCKLTLLNELNVPKTTLEINEQLEGVTTIFNKNSYISQYID